MRLTIAQLRSAGVSDTQILDALAQAQAEQLEKEREQSKVRSRNYRERHRDHPDRVTEITRDARDAVYPSLSTSLLPLEDRTVVKEERLEIVATGREFVTFWQQYPHKVGKRAATTAFARARRRALMPTIMVGLDRYAAKTDDRPWCNPATWLNQDRWEDQVGPSQEGNGKPGVAQAAIDKRKRELMQQLQAQGASPYEIEEAIRGNTGLGQERPGNIAQLRPALGVVRSENQGVEGQLAFPEHRSRVSRDR